MVPLLSDILTFLLDTTPRPGLQAIPGSGPVTLQAVLIPPLIYYIALILLPPFQRSAAQSFALSTVRTVLACIAGVLFFRLPLAYHVPQSIGLTYQLGLVGLYGGCRVLDCFFISPYLFGHIPRRVTYSHYQRPETPASGGTAPRHREWSDGGLKDPFSSNDVTRGTIDLHGKSTPLDTPQAPQAISSTVHAGRKDSLSDASDSYFPDIVQRVVSGPSPIPVYQTARTEPNHPSTLRERMAWALELELSMRGMGFTWTTADVRHTRKTWLPTAGNRLHSIFVNVLPILLGAWSVIRYTYAHYLANDAVPPPQNRSISDDDELFDTALPIPQQLLLTACLGAFLMAAFSLAHSLFAIMLSPFGSSSTNHYWPQLAFFPPLYTTPVYDITSVRQFWSFGWHRLFARLFLVWGVWPGEFLERKILNKGPNEPADVGKVIGAFLASGFVHSFSVRGVLAGDWTDAMGEAKFFALNGLAVVIEGSIVRIVRGYRKKNKLKDTVWYDAWVGRGWWITVLLWTGRNFARGWVKAGLVREMAFM